MKTPIKLNRNIEVRCWRFVGKISKAIPRTWEVAVLKHAKERGAITVRNVSDDLLGGRKPVAKRLLFICKESGLLNDNKGEYSLTDDGMKSAESGRVFVPENGTWTIWASPDTLLTNPILRIEPWEESNAFTEVFGERTNGNGKNRKQDRNQHQRSFKELPDWILRLKSKAFTPPVGNGEIIKIEDFGKTNKAEPIQPESDLQLELIIEPDNSFLSIKGTLDGRDIKSELDLPTLDYDDVWLGLLDDVDLSAVWDTSMRARRVKFPNDNLERSTFEQTINFSNPQIDSYDGFDPTIVEGVPILPSDEVEALMWAKWHLIKRIDNFATTELFADWIMNVKRLFSEFELNLPGRQEIAHELSRVSDSQINKNQYWYLQAAEDWNL